MEYDFPDGTPVCIMLEVPLCVCSATKTCFKPRFAVEEDLRQPTCVID